jgi:energy-coupling factor transporter ATP-binding protein EcfA2
MVAELFARTVVLDQGKVVVDGPTADLMADPKLLAVHGLEA